MRRRFILNKSESNNIIRYISTDGNVISPYKFDFGTSLISNTYTNKGLMVFKSDVTSIGNSAFQYCSSLTRIEIPNSVTNIGDYAFYGCSSLTRIEIPNSVTSIGDWAFSWCTSLTRIEIPNSVTSIGCNAFEDCINLISIQIPNSVTSIEKGAFYNCPGLTSIVVDSGNTKYDSRNGCNAIIETASNTLITGCQNTIIPNSVTSIGVSAFFECTSLTRIEIPNSVTSIGDRAFSWCSSLTRIEIPNSVTSIGDRAFSWCTSLTSVYVKATTPPTLGDNVFYRNISGRKIYVPRASLNAYKTASGWSSYADAIEPYDFDGSVNEITFYIDDGMYVTPMKALSNMTYGEFVNSEYANQNSMLTDFRLKGYGAYNGILFYHEEAKFDMTLYVDNSVHNNVHDYDVIEDGKTYYAY